MPEYHLSNVQKHYRGAGNSPVLDKVCFTIDHIHAGNHHISSTYEVVKCLVDRGIPVTVFFQATSPSNNYELDRQNARLIYNLAPHLVTLGVHPLPSGHSQRDQTDTLNVINGIIQEVTGRKSQVLSYHGHGAGHEPNIRFSGIKYARGIHSGWASGADEPLDTPVMVLNSVDRAFSYTLERNAAGLSSTVFVHSQELVHGSVKKRVFDTIVTEVINQRLQAVSYYSAMKSDFRATSGGGSSSSSTGNGSLRLSALKKHGNHPVKANFYIQKSNGDDVRSVLGVRSQQFVIPAGQYKVIVRVGTISRSDMISLGVNQGIHHVFKV